MDHRAARKPVATGKSVITVAQLAAVRKLDKEQVALIRGMDKAQIDLARKTIEAEKVAARQEKDAVARGLKTEIVKVVKDSDTKAGQKERKSIKEQMIHGTKSDREVVLNYLMRLARDGKGTAEHDAALAVVEFREYLNGLGDVKSAIGGALDDITDRVAHAKKMEEEMARMKEEIGRQSKELEESRQRLEGERRRFLEEERKRKEEEDKRKEAEAGRGRANFQLFGTKVVSSLQHAVHGQTDEEYQKLLKENTEKQKQIEELKNKVSALEAEAATKAELQQQLKEQVVANEELGKANLDLTKRLEVSEVENARLRALIEAMEKELASKQALAQEVESYRIDVQRKQEALDQIDKKNQAALEQARTALEKARQQLADAETRMNQKLLEMLAKFYKEFREFTDEMRAYSLAASVPVASKAMDSTNVGTDTTDMAAYVTKTRRPTARPDTEEDFIKTRRFSTRPSTEWDRPDSDRHSTDSARSSTIVSANDSHAATYASSAVSTSSSIPTRDGSLSREILRINFDKVILNAANHFFRDREEKADHDSPGDRRVVFKSFISGLNKTLSGASKLETSESKSINSVFENAYSKSIKLDQQTFLQALKENPQFKGKFLDWAENFALDIAIASAQNNSGVDHRAEGVDYPAKYTKYNRQDPGTTVGQPVVSYQVTKLYIDLADVKNRLE